MSTLDFANQHAGGFDVVGTVAKDKLYDRFTVRRKVVIASGQGVLARGTLLGKVTASGKWVVSTSAANDGSQTPRAVLLDGVDATSADAEGVVGRAGRCAAGGLILGAGHTLASVDDGLIDRGIYVETIIG